MLQYTTGGRRMTTPPWKSSTKTITSWWSTSPPACRPWAPRRARPRLLTLAKDYVKRRCRKARQRLPGRDEPLGRAGDRRGALGADLEGRRAHDAQFHAHTVEKLYWALVEGRSSPPAARILDWLVHDERHRRVRIAGRRSRGPSRPGSTIGNCRFAPACRWSRSAGDRPKAPDPRADGPSRPSALGRSEVRQPAAVFRGDCPARPPPGRSSIPCAASRLVSRPRCRVFWAISASAADRKCQVGNGRASTPAASLSPASATRRRRVAADPRSESQNRPLAEADARFALAD